MIRETVAVVNSSPGRESMEVMERTRAKGTPLRWKTRPSSVVRIDSHSEAG